MTSTVSDKAPPCPQEKVNRQFRADQPNALWVSDFTYVSTRQGFVHVASPKALRPVLVRSPGTLGY